MISSQRQHLFISWLILFGLIAFSIFVCWERGLVHLIVETDQSKICLIIGAVFVLGTLHCANRAKYISNQTDILLQAERMSKNPEFIASNSPVNRIEIDDYRLPPDSILLTYLVHSGVFEQNKQDEKLQLNLAADILISKAKNSHDFGWFLVDSLIKLGLLGTIIGFILMLATVSVTDNMDVTGLQNIIKNMSAGMGTALYTTLTGLLGSMILALQYLLVDRGADNLIERTLHLSLELSQSIAQE